MESPASQPADFDPALRVTSERAAGRALAVQAAGLSLLLHGVFNDSLLQPHVVGRGLAMAVGAAMAGLLLGPVAVRGEGAGGVVGRAVGLSVVGGALAAVFGAPLAKVGMMFAAQKSLVEIATGQAGKGAFLGLVASISIAPLALLHHRIQSARALDFAPRLYAAACGALVTPSAFLVLAGQGQRAVAALVLAAGAAALAARANARRLDWLARVSGGEEPRYRVEEISNDADDEEIEALPKFAGDAPAGWHVLVRAADGTEERGAHPFRANGAWLVVARVDPGGSAGSARAAMVRAGFRGAAAGLALVVLIGAPLWLLAQPHGR